MDHSTSTVVLCHVYCYCPISTVVLMCNSSSLDTLTGCFTPNYVLRVNTIYVAFTVRILAGSQKAALPAPCSCKHHNVLSMHAVLIVDFVFNINRFCIYYFSIMKINSFRGVSTKETEEDNTTLHTLESAHILSVDSAQTLGQCCLG